MSVRAIPVELLSGRVNSAPATEIVDSDSILGRVKPKIMLIVIHNFLA